MINRTIFNTTDELYDHAAAIFTGVVSSANHTTVALPTGNTPTPFYSRIVKNNVISWENVFLFMLDSYYPQDPEASSSFYRYIKANLLDHIHLPTNNFHILDSNTKNPDAECQAYEALIQKSGGIDLAILGIGKNGHIAFNEPGSAKDSGTRLVEITTSTAKANDPDDTKQLPNQALTMGIGTILQAKKILVLAIGENKAEAVKQALCDEPHSECPASFLQLHPDATFFLDPHAARLL